MNKSSLDIDKQVFRVHAALIGRAELEIKYSTVHILYYYIQFPTRRPAPDWIPRAR